MWSTQAALEAERDARAQLGGVLSAARGELEAEREARVRVEEALAAERQGRSEGEAGLAQLRARLESEGHARAEAEAAAGDDFGGQSFTSEAAGAGTLADDEALAALREKLSGGNA